MNITRYVYIVITFFLSDMQKTMGNIKDSFTSKQCLVINCYQIGICTIECLKEQPEFSNSF